MAVPRGCYGIGVELSGVWFDGVGGAVCRGHGVSVHHDLGCLICVQAAGGGWGGGGGPSQSSTPASAAAPSSRGLLGALRFGPACGSGTGGQHGHQDHQESGQED